VGQPTPQLLDGLTQFDQDVSLERSSGRIHLCLAEEEDLPRLARWILDEGHTLYEMTPHRLSLEERFLQIVGEGSGEG
jgi:hypothetical protein